MAFMLPAPGTTGGLVNYGDLLQAIKQSSVVVNTNNTAGVTDTLSGAQIANGFYIRSGATAAVASTTDTAANIITAMGPNAFIGQTALLFYTNQNTSAGVVTFTGGTGVTLAGLAAVPIWNTAAIVVTITSATTVGFNVVNTFTPSIPNAQFVSISAGNGTLAAGNMEGANICNLASSGATAMTTRTAAQIIAGIPNAQVGFNYQLFIFNSNGGTLTLTGGSGVTITGTATMILNTARIYNVSITGASTVTMQNMGTYTAT